MNKKVLIGIIICVVLVIAAGVVSYIGAQNKDLITYQDPKFPQETVDVLQKRLDEAKQQVADIQKGTPDEEKYNRYLALGMAYSGLGYFAEASDNYNKALDIKPKDANTWQLYSSLRTGMHDYKGALKAVKKAIELDETNSEYWIWQIALEKDYFEADKNRLNDLYVDALLKTRDDLDIITAYAGYLESVNNFQAAKEYWQKAKDKNPESKNVYDENIKRLDAKINPPK